MEEQATLEIYITGNKISPDSFDIRDIKFFLENVDALLFPDNSRNRPIITYSIADGSLKQFFKTQATAVIASSALLLQVNTSNAIDFLEPKRASSIKKIHDFIASRGYTAQFRNSLENKTLLKITPDTHFSEKPQMWLDAELYFYGKIIDAGGKNQANVHLLTEEYGSVIIGATKEQLQSQTDNLLYKTYGVRVKGKQNPFTSEIKKDSLKLIEFVNYNPTPKKEHLNRLIEKATPRWKGIDVDKWLYEIRGDYGE